VKEIFQFLSQHGPLAVISGGLVWLFVLVWKRVDELFQQQHDALLEETKAKGKLAEALEDVASSVDALGVQTGDDVKDCKAKAAVMIGKFDAYIQDRRVAQAKEEGRREVTGRYRIPEEKKDEP
jgi:hypothetical protein